MTDQQTAAQRTSAVEDVEAFAPQASLLDSIISESRVARSESERSRTRDLIGELVEVNANGQTHRVL